MLEMFFQNAIKIVKKFLGYEMSLHGLALVFQDPTSTIYNLIAVEHCSV